MIRHALCMAAAIGLALSIAPLAVAQDYPPEVILAYLDADANGQVDLNDFLNRQLPNLAKFDADQDGMLNYKEFKESLVGVSAKQNAERSFEMFDSEKPRGKLAQREFLGYHAYVFKTFFDTNHDGIMSLSEWTFVMGRGKAKAAAVTPTASPAPVATAVPPPAAEPAH